MPEEAQALLEAREPHPDLQPHPDLPADTRLWAALQAASGGVWAGSVYDVDKITDILQAGLQAVSEPASGRSQAITRTNSTQHAGAPWLARLLELNEESLCPTKRIKPTRRLSGIFGSG